MTDRFYPLGKHAAEDVWKTSYEVQNEMRAFQRSAYPPGYAGHEPGSREKFGFSTPGPDAARLTKSELALSEDVDIAEPRRHLAMTRMPVTDERQTFRDLDVPEMDRSYKSAIVSPAFRSMAKTRSLPSLARKPVPPRLGQVPAAQAKLEDDHFTYFVPRALNREATEQIMARNPSKLYKDAKKKVVLPFSGDGTGFRTSCSGTEWWPTASCLHEEPSSYASDFQRPSFYRMSPLNVGSFRRSVQFDATDEGDGFGSIRLGTPTLEERAQKRPHFLTSGALEKSSASPEIKATPAARFGYMPPSAGRISQPGSSSGRSPVPPARDSAELSSTLLAKVLRLYQMMDTNSNGAISRAEAKCHFKRYAELSTNAMFNEVDEDRNDVITFDEFVDFWQQVKRSGYPEEDLSNEIDELLKGNVWVDYADSREVGPSMDMRKA